MRLPLTKCVPETSIASLWPGIADVRSVHVHGTAAQAHLLDAVWPTLKPVLQRPAVQRPAAQRK